METEQNLATEEQNSYDNKISENERDNIDKKLQLPHLPKQEFIDREDVEDIKEKYEDKLLENIQIPAEIKEEREIPKTHELQENIGAIKPFENLDRIEDKIQEIKQDVDESKLEQMQENREIEQGIETERFDSKSNLDNIEQSRERQEMQEKLQETQEIQEERPETEEQNLNENRDIEKNISDIKESEKEEDREEADKESNIEKENQGISSEPSSPESIGVYNPNEEDDSSPQKMEYRFDDDEDIYSDVF